MEYTALFDILRRGQLTEARAYMEKEPKAVNAVDEEGTAAILRIMQTGDFDLCRWTAEQSLGKLNTVDANGAGALHYAAECGDAALLRYLVERAGFDPLAGDRLGRTPYSIAHAAGNTEGETYFAQSIGAKWENLYQNPILSGFHPDPSIVRVGEDYYMVNSSFMWFPALPIRHSRDLVHWEPIGHVLTDENTAMLKDINGGCGYWAPDISYYHGRYYVTATLRRNDGHPRPRAQIVTSAPVPEGPWEPPAVIEENGIDPSLFVDDDGKRYMLLNRGARLLPLSANAREAVGPARLLWYGDTKRASEGPRMLKKDGWYYLILAEGGTGMSHQISVGRSRTLDGPYEACPYNPVLHQYNPNGTLQKSGHGHFVQTPDGQWYAVYLCARPVDGMCPLGRETALDPVTWTEDGWPLVNRRKGPSAQQIKPPLPVFLPRRESMDPASPRTLWISPRQSAKARWENNVLSLDAHILDLDDKNSRAGIYRRQTALSCQFTVHIENEPADGQQIGIAAYYDECSFCKFGKQKGRLVITLREPDGWKQLFSSEKDGDWLRITADGLERRFLCSGDGENWETVYTIPRAEFLCDEGKGCVKRFTGAMFGLYAIGEAFTARFDSISYVDF